jgi:hypothetical protein
MIGFFEGALSSRRKRADIIIRRRGNKSRMIKKKFCGTERKPAVFKQQKRGKMISLYGSFLQPAKERLGSIIAFPRKNARPTAAFPKPAQWLKMGEARRRRT